MTRDDQTVFPGAREPGQSPAVRCSRNGGRVPGERLHGGSGHRPSASDVGDPRQHAVLVTLGHERKRCDVESVSRREVPEGGHDEIRPRAVQLRSGRVTVEAPVQLRGGIAALPAPDGGRKLAGIRNDAPPVLEPFPARCLQVPDPFAHEVVRVDAETDPGALLRAEAADIDALAASGGHGERIGHAHLEEIRGAPQDDGARIGLASLLDGADGVLPVAVAPSLSPDAMLADRHAGGPEISAGVRPNPPDALPVHGGNADERARNRGSAGVHNPSPHDAAARLAGDRQRDQSPGKSQREGNREDAGKRRPSIRHRETTLLCSRPGSFPAPRGRPHGLERIERDGSYAAGR